MRLEIPWTVVEAVTAFESRYAPSARATHPSHMTPREDLFARCLEATRGAVRALRQATDHPYGLPTYVRTNSPVLIYSATGVQEIVEVQGEIYARMRPTSAWDDGQLLMLDHANLPDPFPGSDLDEASLDVFKVWLDRFEAGDPLTIWRERWVEARRAHEVAGEDAQAVILANTACEVLLDTVLVLLMWEEDQSPEEAEKAFAEGHTLRRLSNEMAPRLKGDWSTERGSVGQWYENLYRLRHRVVHGGYEPTPIETTEAMSAATSLETFVMDRIADRRTTYMRAALLTLGEPGLRRRGLWSGKIAKFANNEGHAGATWQAEFLDYYNAVFRLRER